MKVNFLSDSNEDSLTRFLLKDEHTLFSYSLKLRNLIKTLSNSEDIYLLAEEDDEILGVLPTFIKINNKYGNILNSLPFYGNHGGVLARRDLPPEKQMQVKKSLIDRFYQLEKEYDCISSTLITSPFENDLSFYEKNFLYTHRDNRICQIMELPPKEAHIEKALMKQFKGSRRTDIRRAIKSGVIVKEDASTKTKQFLLDTHTISIKNLKGIPKPAIFFESISKYMTWGTDYKIYSAWKNQVPIAALLLFYFNKTVEYFTPIFQVDFGVFKPLSLIIYKSMEDAIKSGYKYYNFGGTWKSQGGVHFFKTRFGAKDFEYNYLTKLNRDINYFKELNEEKLLQEYKYFYAIPFSELK